MKIKKLIVVMVAACMLVMSQAAYATEVSPTAIGIGDTQASAVPIVFGPGEWAYHLNMFLSNANDVDWFKWENNTSSPVQTSSYLFDYGDNSGTFRLGAKIAYSNGSETTLLFNDDNQIRNIQVPPGATLYLRIEATNFFSSSELYSFTFTRVS